MTMVWMQTDWESPELRFWKRFLIFTVEDLYSLRNTYRRTAQAWIQSDNDGVGSFIWICDLFNKDPTAVRNRLLHQPYPPLLLGKGGLIREHRRRYQISQLDMAKAIGCSSSTLSRFETGRKKFERLPAGCQHKINTLLIQSKKLG